LAEVSDARDSMTLEGRSTDPERRKGSTFSNPQPDLSILGGVNNLKRQSHPIARRAAAKHAPTAAVCAPGADQPNPSLAWLVSWGLIAA